MRRRESRSLPSTRATSGRPRWTRCSGDPSKARRKLGWEPRISFEELVTEMVMADLKEAEKDTMVQQKGYRIYGNSE